MLGYAQGHWGCAGPSGLFCALPVGPVIVIRADVHLPSLKWDTDTSCVRQMNKVEAAFAAGNGCNTCHQV
jgi:hypothetical protein